MDSLQSQPQPQPQLQLPLMMQPPPNNNYSSENNNFEMLQSRQLGFNSAKSEYVDTIRAASARKKIGRPRKYFYSADGEGSSAAEPTPKRKGRPPGTGKKQLQPKRKGRQPGVGFTPHVITITAGEDIASKIMDFSQQGPRTVCILSANGAISNVTLRQPAMSGGTVTFEGLFEIISLSGSFSHSDSNGNTRRTSSLSVSMATLDGRVLGGGVSGMLIAAAPVQVIVGSFIADGTKPKSGPASAPP